MNEREHTPLPWEAVLRFAGSVNAKGGVQSEDAYRIKGPKHPVCDGADRSTDEIINDGLLFCEADARFIIRAVNAHDDLVAACEGLIVALPNQAPAARGPGGAIALPEGTYEAWQAGEAALAKAKGE